MQPRVFDEPLVLQPLQKWVKRSTLKAGKADLPQNFGDGVTMVFTMIEHSKNCLRQCCPD